MRNLIMAAIFKDVQKTYDIRIDVSPGIFQTVSDTCLCSEIHDSVKSMLVKNILNGIRIFQISFNETEVFFCTSSMRRSRLSLTS